ncbi:MAG: hypothetical protein ACLGIN_14595, partial [Candidatus Sericytochromatia bacterium]
MNLPLSLARSLAALFLLVGAAFPVLAQQPSAPVELDGQPVLIVGGSNALTAVERAGILAHRLAELSSGPEAGAWQVLEKDGGTHLATGDRIFLTITADDLEVNQAESAVALAARWQGELAPALDRARAERSWEYTARAFGLAGLFTLILWLANWGAT